MVNGRKRTAENGPKSTGSASGSRKLTLSCSRCRTSKLKCDRKEPCIECIKRDIGHLCTKDERQPRAKRAKKETSLEDIWITSREDEEAAEAVESFIDGLGHSKASGWSSSKVASDSYNEYYPLQTNTISLFSRRDGKIELLKDILEALPPEDMIRTLSECFVTRCQAPLGNIVHAPLFLRITDRLCKELNRACENETDLEILDHTVSLDVLACILLALALGLAFFFTPGCQEHDAEAVAYRVDELRKLGMQAKWRSLALRCLQGEISIFCGSIPSLQAALMLLLEGHGKAAELDGLLVSAISGARRLGLHRLGNAELTASAPFTFYDCVVAKATPPHIRTELGIRIWWALVVRDWTRAQALGYYTIQPSQFNTRMPLHINDEDLFPRVSSPDGYIKITERPRSEFTTLSYTVHCIEIATLVRESVDLRGSLLQSPRPPASRVVKMRNDLRRKFDAFSAGLPSHFQVGSEVGLALGDLSGPLVAVPVHRWMLHQQLWTLFLRFHRANLSSTDERAACRLYAKNIIATGERIRRWCIVCGSLSLGDAQLFSAAAMLIIDLLLPPGPNAGDLQEMRREHLEKVDAALTLFKDRGHAATQPDLHSMPWRQGSRDDQLGRVKVSARRCIMTLEALLKLEEQNGTSQRSETKKTKKSAKGAAKKSLKEKIFDVLEPLHYLVPEGMSFSYPNSSDFQDPDVLPVLSSQPGSRFWQDVALSVSPRTSATTGFFPASVDWETLIDWLPPSPNPGDTNLLDSYDFAELSQMDGNTDGCDPMIELDTL